MLLAGHVCVVKIKARANPSILTSLLVRVGHTKKYRSSQIRLREVADGDSGELLMLGKGEAFIWPAADANFSSSVCSFIPHIKNDLRFATVASRHARIVKVFFQNNLCYGVYRGLMFQNTLECSSTHIYLSRSTYRTTANMSCAYFN